VLLEPLKCATPRSTKEIAKRGMAMLSASPSRQEKLQLRKQFCPGTVLRWYEGVG